MAKSDKGTCIKDLALLEREFDLGVDHCVEHAEDFDFVAFDRSTIKVMVQSAAGELSHPRTQNKSIGWKAEFDLFVSRDHDSHLVARKKRCGVLRPTPST